MSEKINAIVMAAGKGTRMMSADLPKVLFPLNGKPMLSYVIKNLAEAGVYNPVIVVGFLAEKVKEHFGPTFRYAKQEIQNGTAQAVLSAKQYLENENGITIIASGDQPFISPNSINKLIETTKNTGSVISMLAGEFNGNEFDAFGRVILNEQGEATAIVEAKNATSEQLKIRLFNLATYAVNNKWLWENLPNIKPNSLTNEYYLTDIVELANKQGEKVSVVITTNENEAVGVNTPEHLELAEKRLILTS